MSIFSHLHGGGVGGESVFQSCLFFTINYKEFIIFKNIYKNEETILKYVVSK